MTASEIEIIRQEYRDLLFALRIAEKECMADKRSRNKRAVFEFVAAQEEELFNIALKLGVDLTEECAE